MADELFFHHFAGCKMLSAQLAAVNSVAADFAEKPYEVAGGGAEDCYLSASKGSSMLQ
ncbi:MAG: hypothetical protein JSS69_06070 [Acidobacteria bacterium]|nr:hypothetical protein [Acidobacteriota bacterium]MBS1865468.1 hypothetical protein [Acidobacteriota bacterium]